MATPVVPGVEPCQSGTTCALAAKGRNASHAADIHPLFNKARIRFIIINLYIAIKGCRITFSKFLFLG
jgi:hypothetical protein